MQSYGKVHCFFYLLDFNISIIWQYKIYHFDSVLVDVIATSHKI